MLIMLFSLSIREDMALVAIGFCLAMLFDRKGRNIAICMLPVFALIFIFLIEVVIPSAAPIGTSTQNRFLIERWGSYGTTLWSIMWGLFSSPIHVTLSAMKGYLSLVSPLLWIPLLSPQTLLLALPFVLLHSTSGFKMEALLKLHYAFPVIPIVFFAYIRSIKKLLILLQEKFPMHAKSYSYYLIILIGAYIFVSGFKYTLFVHPDANLIRQEALSKIPNNVTVAAQTNFVPHLMADHIHAFMFPSEGSKKYQDAQYVLIDTAFLTWPLSKEEYENIFQELSKTDKWKLVWNKETSFVFKKHT